MTNRWKVRLTGAWMGGWTLWLGISLVAGSLIRYGTHPMLAYGLMAIAPATLALGVLILLATWLD